MQDLANKRIIVTGGTYGIGAAIVKLYLELGAQVAFLARSKTPADKLLADLNREYRDRAYFIQCDVAEREQVKQAFKQANKFLGCVEALVHVAGIETSCPAENITDELWDELLTINAKGTFITNQEIYPYLRDAGGSIINFGSAAGIAGLPGSAAYSASKGAVTAWSRALATEWAPHNIRVNIVCPAIWTSMYDGFRSKMTPEQLTQHDVMMSMTIPLGGKLGDADRDLAPMLAFIVSDGAKFITGQTLAIDGGILMVR